VIGLVLIVKNEAAFIERCLSSAKPLISHWTIVDTGSTDDTKKIIRRTLKGIPGKLHEREFVDFGHNRTEALELAKGTGEWLLELDADMTVEAHEGLLEWLEKDPDPDVAAWQVEIVDSGTLWRLPRLIRGNLDWRYIGPVHEYLDPAGRKQRALLGLTITHHGSSRHPIQKFDHYLRLLKPGASCADVARSAARRWPFISGLAVSSIRQLWHRGKRYALPGRHGSAERGDPAEVIKEIRSAPERLQQASFVKPQTAVPRNREIKA